MNNIAFATFFAAVTDTQGVEFELKVSADVVARTTIGDIPITNIPFNVTSPMRGEPPPHFLTFRSMSITTTRAGINSLGRTASLGNVTITGSGGSGGNQFINADLTTTFQNPSNISLQTSGVSLVVFYKDVKIGRAAIDVCLKFFYTKSLRGSNFDLQMFNLVPGENTVPAEFHYQPDNANDTTAQSFLHEFIQTGNSLLLSIKGDPSSSPYPSLVPALEGVSLSSGLTGESTFLSAPGGSSSSRHSSRS